MTPSAIHWQHGAAGLLRRAIDLRKNPKLRKSVERWLATPEAPTFDGKPDHVAEAWAKWAYANERPPARFLIFKEPSVEPRDLHPHDVASWILLLSQRQRREAADAERGQRARTSIERAHEAAQTTNAQRATEKRARIKKRRAFLQRIDYLPLGENSTAKDAAVAIAKHEGKGDSWEKVDKWLRANKRSFL